MASRTTVPASGRDDTSSVAPISSARSRMNCNPKLRRPRAATAPDVEPTPVVADLHDPRPVLDPRGDRRLGRPGVLAHILQRFLDDPQGDRLLGLAEPVARGPQVRLDRGAHERGPCLRGVVDRAVQAELVEERRPELADERPDVAELAAEELAQVAQLRPGHPRVLVHHPLDVLDLEDRVRQGLGRTVVDLLGQAGPLGLLGLDDPHLHVVRPVRSGPLGHEAGVAALQEEPGALQAPVGELEPGELRLAATELHLQALDLRPEGTDPGVLGAGLGRLHGLDRGALRWVQAVAGRDGPDAARPALERVELVAQDLVAGEVLPERLAVALGNGVDRVRGIAERRLRLRVELIEAAVSSVPDPRAVHVVRV